MEDGNRLNLSPSTSGSRSATCYEKLDMIGEGTYGQVFKARDKATGGIVALKRIRMDREQTEGFPITAIREIRILSKLRHENLIKLKEIVTSTPVFDDDIKENPAVNQGSILMVFEYMDHDLAGLTRRAIKFTVPQIKCYMKQLLTALHFCHVNKVLHRDVKASNILIDNNGILKLGDFGLARVYSDRQDQDPINMTNNVITLWYRPPELLLGCRQYGPAVDMWSVGCIFAELLRGKPIFPGQNEAEQLRFIFQICGSAHPSVWPEVSELPHYNAVKENMPLRRQLRETFSRMDPRALDLLDKMLVLDPKKRISAEEALNHEYFWSDPRPCEPSSLPTYESSHEYTERARKKRATDQRHFHPVRREYIPPADSSTSPRYDGARLQHSGGYSRTDRAPLQHSGGYSRPNGNTSGFSPRSWQMRGPDLRTG